MFTVAIEDGKLVVSPAARPGRTRALTEEEAREVDTQTRGAFGPLGGRGGVPCPR